MKQILETKDFLVSGESFSICKDPTLDLLKTDPLPDNLDTYYKSDEYLSHKDSAKGIMATMYSWVKKLSTVKKIRLIKQYANRSLSILDIGAGTGDLLLAARQAGFNVEGVEPNSDARQLARNKGIALQSKIDFPNRFQIITMWHVLEHIKDLDEQITLIKDHLEDNGTLFIAVPNFKSYDAEYYKEFWAAYDVPRHIWHFSKSAIKKLFEDHKMELIRTEPMVFDAYYISLLSEKYKHGKMKFLKAFYIGLKSNLKARKSGEYSSMLYIFQKQQ